MHRHQLSPEEQAKRNKDKGTENKRLQRERVGDQSPMTPATHIKQVITQTTRQQFDHMNRMKLLDEELVQKQQAIKRTQDLLEQKDKARLEHMRLEQEKRNELDRLQSEYESWQLRLREGDDGMADA